MPALPRRGPLAVTATKFLTVGALSTLIEVAVFNLLFSALDASAVAAKIVASLVALANAYVGNRQWTFAGRDVDSRGRQLARFLVANAVCTGLGAAIVWAADATLTHGSEAMSLVVLNVVNVVSIALIVLLRFLVYHFWVFRKVRTLPRRPEASPLDGSERRSLLEVAHDDGR